ncbi:MAG: AAC(3) family N-acetyltransferase [Fibrobacterales bacterium]
MDTFTKNDLITALKAIGLKQNDVVYFQTELFSIGIPEGISLDDKDSYCQFFIDTIFDVIGSNGTLVILTASTQVARFDEEYDPKTTKSSHGLLANYVISHPDFVRTLSPMFSFAATGKYKHEICRTSSTHNYGARSPLDQLVKYNAINIFLGFDPSYGFTILHYAEFMYGVPHCYNKVLKWKPMIDGTPCDKTYVASVRFLEYELKYNLKPFVQVLRDTHLIKDTTIGMGTISACSIPEVIELALDKLEEDVYYFLDEPPNFEYGKIPFDGPTAGRDGIA